MSNDPLEETIRGATADDLRRKIAESKAKTAGLHEFMVDEEKRQGELILIEASTLIHPNWLDTFKRVGFGTCHIQQPDGMMKLVSVSVVRAEADPWEGSTPEELFGREMDSPKFEPERWQHTTKEEAKSHLAMLQSGQWSAQDLAAFDKALAERKPPRKPSLLRRMWTAWCEFWESGTVWERWE